MTVSMNEKNFIQKDCTSTEPPKSSHDRTFKGVRDFAEEVSVVSAETTLIDKNGFRMMALDIFSLMFHLDELRIFLREKKPHIVSISETKIDSMIENSVSEIEDYVVERNDRNKHGGGVAMYIHKSIDYSLREDLLRSDIESIFIQVKLGNYKPFIVTSLYRPPGKNVAYFKELDNLFGTLDTEDKETIYFGDTNCDMLDPAYNDTKHLKKLLIKFNLVQLIKDPTWTTVTTKTIIGHIITNKSEFVSESGILSCGVSDHDVVFLTKQMRLPKLKAPPKILNVRNYERFNLNAFR